MKLSTIAPFVLSGLVAADDETTHTLISTVFITAVRHMETEAILGPSVAVATSSAAAAVPSTAASNDTIPASTTNGTAAASSTAPAVANMGGKEQLSVIAAGVAFGVLLL